jgi:hypothetical protein
MNTGICDPRSIPTAYRCSSIRSLQPFTVDLLVPVVRVRTMSCSDIAEKPRPGLILPFHDHDDSADYGSTT